jgi:hypothetical protein
MLVKGKCTIFQQDDDIYRNLNRSYARSKKTVNETSQETEGAAVKTEIIFYCELSENMCLKEMSSN